MNLYLKLILQGGVLLLLQLGVIDNLYFGSWTTLFNPMVYVLFILSIPLSFPSTLVLFIAFCYGLTLDLFKSTLGLHASAILIVALIRPFVLSIVSPREGHDPTTTPGVYTFGVSRYFTYVSVSLLAYHLWFFFIEVLRLNAIPDVILKSFFSTLFGVGIVFLIQFLTQKPRKIG